MNALQPVVMIVDDDEDFRELIRDFLSDRGYRVVEAGDGIEAFRVAAEQAPDVILLDVMMPARNGFDVCRDLKNDDRTRSSAVVMLTVKNRLSDKLTAYMVGAQRFLTKPCEMTEIEDCLRAVLHQRSINLIQYDQDFN